MMQISMFKSATGRQLRDAGQKRVMTHNREWGRKAAKVIEAEFQYLVVTSLFTGEDLHQWADDAGLEQPDHPNAWSAITGSLLRAWLKSGRIEAAGAINASRPEAHSRLIRRYKKVAP